MFWSEPINQSRVTVNTPRSGQEEHHILPIISMKDSGLDPERDQSIQRSWIEFSTGMRMLQKNWQRINARADEIARANLRLLHNNLRTSNDYKNALSNLKQNIKNHSLIYRWSASEYKNEACAIIGINKASNETNNLKSFLRRPLMQYIPPGQYELTVSNVTCMYLVLGGELLVSRKIAELPTKNQVKTHRTYSIDSYKSGDVLLIPYNDIEGIIDIRATQKYTRLLGVSITEAL